MPQTVERASVEAGAEELSLRSRKFFDEMRDETGKVRPAFAAFAELLEGLSMESLVTKQKAAEEIFRRMGITFAVYGESRCRTPDPVRYRAAHPDRGEWKLCRAA